MLAWFSLAALAVSASFPLHNPDLFWHLAAGRLMASTGTLPRFEPFAAGGQAIPWIGFEWLSELIFYGVWNIGGYVGLVAFKAALAAAAGWLVDRAMKDAGLSTIWRAAGLLTLAALAQKRWMAEPELFTFLLLAGLGRALLSRPKLTARWTLGACAVFSLWADLHGGWVYGLGLLFLHLAFRKDQPLSRRAGVLAACAAATLINPYGWRVYEVPLFLMTRLGALHAGNMEYLPPIKAAGVVFKLYYLLPLAGLVLAWRRRTEAEVLALIGVFGLWGALAVRQIAVAAVVLVPLVFPLLARQFGEGGKRLAAVCAAGWALLLSQSFALGAPWRGLADVYPLALTDAALRAPGTILLPFELAGYAVWRAAPGRRVWVYGRLDAFADRLAELKSARGRPEDWNALLDRRGIDVVVETRPAQTFPGSISDAKTGRVVPVRRSPLSAYFPRERWSLAGWDDRGLVFVRGAGKGYSLLDPSDLSYLGTLAREGWLDRATLAGELRRHESDWGPSRFDAAFAELIVGR